MILVGCCCSTNTYLNVKGMGYDYAELSGRQIMSLSNNEFLNFLGLYKASGFPCRGFNDYCGAEYPIVGQRSGDKSCEEYAKKICERGALLGIRTIGIGAPTARILQDGYPLEKADEDMRSFLKMICKYAEPYGITILLEAVHKYMCNYLNYTEDAVKMVRDLDIPNLKIVLDYYHAMVMGEDLHHFEYAMPYVRHLHISTDLERHSRGYMRESDIPFMRQLFEEAIATGYHGGISVEAGETDLMEFGTQNLKHMRAALDTQARVNGAEE